MSIVQQIKVEIAETLDEYQQQAQLIKGDIFVVGCSTSEIAGERIGTSGSFEIAQALYHAFKNYADQHGVYLAFQCCEHLNRALVVERKLLQFKDLEEVSVIPHRKAGGAMATYAFEQFEDPVVVEFIRADGGIDIGSTLIGMHLKHVAVPVRVSRKRIGHAPITLAKTRPKLIGGERAIYTKRNDMEKCN